MADRFNLTAALQLQAPTNTAQVISQIQKELGKLGVTNIKINADTRSLAAVQGQLQKVDKSARSSAKGMGVLGRNISEAARRFSVITIATGSFIALARSIKQSVGAALEFEREMVKISQVTGSSVKQLSSLSQEVTRLSTSLGVANQSLLETSRILAQAGFSALKTRQALEILANTTLAPSFDNIIDTTEGAIAIINQFGRAAKKTGSEIQFLENALDAINQVSKTFAVESKDLITAVRRTGGVFEAAGGKLNELIALFTAVRQTTRESAETIATGFRTIFTRLQRSETLDALEQLGIALSDVEGKFIGPMKAVEALSVGLAGLDPKDVRFNEIVEQLGGFRQIGKVIPLIKQYAVATEALAVANTSAGSTSRDAETAQQSLAVQFQKVVQQFDALIRKFAESETFRGMATTIIKLAETFLKFAESLEKVLPLLTAIAAIKIGRALAPGLKGMFGGGGGKQFGGMVRGFSGGGFVPGRGNRDTVPAMLQPGEFVIKKSSARQLGADRLRSMNQYENGGKTKKKKEKKLGQLVSARGAPQKSHIGADLVLGDDELKRIFASKSIKFQRSFVANVLGKDINALSDQEVRGHYANNSAKFGRMQFEKMMGGTAKTPLMLNFPASYNQALRIKDPDLVAKEKLATYMLRGPQLFGALPAPLRKGLDQTNLRKSLGAQTLLTRAQAPGSAQNPTGVSAFNSDPELNPLKGFLKTELEKVDEKAVSAMFDKIDIMFKGSGKLVKSKSTGKEKKRTSGDRATVGKNLGGLIQRFAMGGIAKVNRIGAAILDPDMAMAAEDIAVGVKDVQAAIGGSGAEPSLVRKNFGKIFKSKKYKLSRQGLNQKTSEGFRQKLIEGVATGLDHATSTLGSDLGLGSSKLDSGSRQEFMNYIGKRPIVGDLFEAAVQSLGTSGKFAESAVSAPFDFPGGLSGKLADNYSNLPKSWIDAKSSYMTASTGNMKGKIVSELVAELHRSGEYARLAKSPKKVAAEQAATATAVKKAAKGGSISGTDSVPSLLTPGEFVVKKSAAQSIGYANLKQMNQTGLARFAAGGRVVTGRGRYGELPGLSGDVTKGMKGKDIALANAAAKANAEAFRRLTEQIKNLDPEQARAALTYFGRNFTEAGDEAALLDGALEAAYRNTISSGPSGSEPAPMDVDPGMSESREKFAPSGDMMAEMAQNADALAQEFSFMGEETRAGQKAQMAYRQAVMNGSTEAEAMSEAWHTGSQFQTKMAKEMEKLLTEYREGKISEDELQKATEKLAKERAAGKTGPSTGPGPTPPAGAPPAAPKKERFGRTKDVLGKINKAGNAVSSGMQRLATGLIGLSFVMGTVIQSMSSLDDAEKEQIQAGMAAVTAWGAIGAEVGSFVAQMVAQAAAIAATIISKFVEVSASMLSAGADTVEAGASGLSTVADTGEAIGSAITTVADVVEAGGSAIATGADLAEAGASMSVTLALIPLAVAAFAVMAVFALLAIAVAAIALAFGGGFLMSLYKTAVAVKAMEQSIEKFNDVASAEMDKLKAGEGGSKEKFVKSSVGAATTDFEKQIVEATAMSRHLSTGLQAAGYAAAGAAIGFALLAPLGPIGMALGAAIGGVTGAIVGAWQSWTGADKAIEETIKRQAHNQALIVSASTRLASTTWDNVKALKTLESTLSDATAANLSAVQTLGIMSDGAANISAQLETSASEMDAAGQEMKTLRNNLSQEGLMTAGGTVVEAAGDDERTAAQEQAISRFKELSKQYDNARKSHNEMIKKATSQEAKLRNQLAKAVGELIGEIAKGSVSGDLGAVNLADIKSLDDLVAASAVFGNAWADALEGINKSIDEQFKVREAEAEKFIKQGGARAVKGRELQKETGVLKAARKTEAKANVQKAAIDRVIAEQKAQMAILRTAHIEALKAKALADVNTSLKGLNNALLGATNTARNFAKIGSSIQLANLEGPDAAMMDTAAFDVGDLRQIDEDILNKALEQGVAAMTIGTGVGDEIDKQIVNRANSMKDSVLVVKDVMDNVASAWSDQIGKALPQQEGARRELAANMFDQLNASVGGALQAGGVDTDVGELIRLHLKEAMDKGDPIDFEFIQELTEGLDAGATLEAMKAFVEAQNQFISKMDEVNTAIIDLQNKYAEALANVVDVTERAADRMANIRGKPRGRFEKETGRRTAAQARLGTTATGAGAIAGDVNATANALKTLKDQADASTTAAKTASAKNKVALNKQAKDQANAAKKATDELRRLADQSARAADIEAEIAKEREKRGQVTSVLEEFAFAGREQQADMTGQMRDVLTAASQGSMAGATDKQRAGIGSMLDKLADVEIGDTGKTGRELKAELTEKQLVSQGVDPRLARQVGEEAAKGSKEEQLLGELEALGQQEIAAAQELAAHQITQIDYLERIANNTEGDFDRDISAGQRKAEGGRDRSGEEATIASLEAQSVKLETAIGEMSLKQEQFAATIKAAAETIATATKAVGAMTKDIEATPVGQAYTGAADLDPKIYGAGVRAGKGAVAPAVKPGDPTLRDTSWAANVDVQVEPVEITLLANMPDWLTADVLGTTPTLAKVGIKSHSGAGNMSAEGVSEFAKGGSVFQPRGTDTVPAMLTPGEFVIRKSAVDKIGVGNLAALNSGAAYHQQGGMVGLPTAGAINSAFYKLIKGGKRTEVVDSLTKAGFKDGRRIYKDLRELAEAGKLDVRKMQGPQQLENMFQILRQFKWLRGVNPTSIGFPDISSNIAGLDAGTTYERDANSVWRAIGQVSSYSDNLLSTKDALKKMGGVSPKGMKFAGEMIKKAGLTKGNFADALGVIQSNIATRSQTAVGNTTKFKNLFKEATATEDSYNTGELKQVPTKHARDQWFKLSTALHDWSGTATTQNKADEEQLGEKKEGAVMAELGNRLGKIYLRLKDQGVLRMAKGGSVADTIPAMLTPGEFVMSPEAVQKHGVGFMRDLNRGHAPGFRRGGLIGRGNVAYRRRGSNNAEGGGTTLMVDPSSLQAVLSEFNAQFVGYLDIMISEFALNTGALTGLTNAIQGGMVMTHNFSGALEFNVKIGNKKNIEEAVAKGLEGTLQTMIETEVDKKITKMKDEP